MENNLMEKFVESQLNERFGRADVVQYLSNRQGSHDAWMKCWLNIASQLFTQAYGEEPYGEIITRFDTPIKRLGVTGTGICDFVGYYLCQKEEVEVYSLYPNYLVKFPKTYEGKALSGGYCVIGRGNSDLTAEDVIQELAGFRWIEPEEEAKRPDYYRDKPRGARELLLDRLKRLVKEEMNRAKYDFSKACAVSADGAKITIADRVIVVKNDGTVPVFDAELFHDKKIERPAKIGRVKAYTTGDVRTAIDMVRTNQFMAVYAAAHNMKWNDDFVVHESLVPQPLPAHSGSTVQDIV
jgi:hypothetical protein